MPYSTQRVTSDGTLVLLAISIDYFDRTEISVLFDGVVDAYPWAWVGSTDKSISFSPAVPNLVEVTVVRTSDLSAIRHSLSGGAAFTDKTMDENFQQILNIAQEARENATISDIFQDVDVHGYKIHNVGDGVAAQDAVNVQQLTVHDSTIVGYKNSAAASAAAAAVSETNAAASAASAAGAAATAVSAHEAAGDPHPNYLLNSEVGSVVQGYDANTVKKNVAQTFTASQRGTITTDNDGSFDQSVTNNFKCTPTGAVTLTFTNHTAGQSGMIIFVNGGNYAITAASTTYIAATDLTKLSTTGTYLISYLDDGTNAYCTVTSALTSSGA